MVKKYIFFNPWIQYVGGGELYVAGKAKYLEKHDWQVYIFFFNGKPNGECEIPSLTKYVYGGYFPETATIPNLFSEDERNRILDRMVKILRVDDSVENQIIIESVSSINTQWAELLAERIHARHFFSTCEEVYRSEGQKYFENLDFFYFKYKRKEIIDETSSKGEDLQRLFNGFKNVTESNLNVPPEVEMIKEQDPIQDVDNPLIDQIPTLDYNIAYIGRVEKPFVPAIFNGVAEFAKNHLDKKIQFIIVGKIHLKQIELLEHLFTELPNVSIFPTDVLVPIPRSIFKKIDVVMAGLQTSAFCAYENVPVINASPDHDRTMGCIYYDKSDSTYGDPRYSYVEMLEKVLIKREYDNRTPILPERHPDSWHYEKILEIQLTQATQPLEYFTEKFKKDLSRTWIAIFPFHAVKKDSKIVIYGFNEISKDYESQIENYCQVVANVTDEWQHYDKTILPPEKLSELEYDAIVIAEPLNQERVSAAVQNIINVTGKPNFIYDFQILDNA